ncbi:MAG: lamin tail domain-containing protein [Actinomycetota bacterium]
MRGASAAPDDVLISEFMYNPLSGLDSDEFLELANRGATAVDIGGWCFSGITLCLPSATTIAAHGYFVVSPDAARFQLSYGFAPNAVYTGKLSNGGETLAIKDAGAIIIDTVTYGEVDPWPTTPDGLGPSLEVIDPSLNNDDSLDWAASTAAAGHTAGAANSVAGTGLGPRISGVAATPLQPAPNQAVTVMATITDMTGTTLRYRTDFGAEQSKPMTPAGGNTFTATIPGAAAGHLIRFRIEATNAIRTSRFPRSDDTAIYLGVVVASGITSAIPVLEWFIADADYNDIVSNPTADIDRKAVLAYNGTVYDNVQVNIRGAASQKEPKPNWKFEMAHGHDLDMPGILIEPVDEFAMQADWGDHSFGRALLSWDAYALAGVVNTQVIPVRTQRNAQFQGLYHYVDLFDGTWRDREGYSEDQFFKASHGAFDATRPLVEYRFEKKNPDDGDFAPIQAFVDGVDLTGTAQRNFLLANVDIPQMINYAAVTAIVQHVDSSTKNFYLSQDADTGRWEIIPWDLDHTWGRGCCGVNSNFVTPAEPGDQVSELMQGLLAVPEWRQMYFRRLRTLVNEVLASGRLESLYDAKVGPSQPEATLDFAAWPHGAGKTYANQRTALFNAIAARRTIFANDARLPGQQGATPNIVINEIQHSPEAGDDAEFLELYNPSATEAVDLSGWSISDAVALQIQPGTVILPQGTMVFVANDPTFRATYGSNVFVGGIYDGGLSSATTITLQRGDGSVADSVSYGGTGWPVASGGPSLELLNPSSDNADPANWALSVATGGTPGAPNQSSGGGTDTVPPNGSLAVPTNNQVFTVRTVVMSGGATDDRDVGRVAVAIRNLGTGQWLRSNGTFGAWMLLNATITADNGSSVSWTFTTPSLPPGRYRVNVAAFDAAGNKDPTVATAAFTVQ